MEVWEGFTLSSKPESGSTYPPPFNFNFTDLGMDLDWNIVAKII